MQKLSDNFKFVLGFVCLLWLIFLASMVLPIDFRHFGIMPRNVHGLVGIIFAPFFHANLPHLLANTFAFLPLLLIALCYDFSSSIRALAIIMLVSGIGTWLFGSPGSVHIGASSLIFGLVGFLLFVGIYQRSLKAILTSIIVFCLYGGSLWSLVIFMPGISWVGHFFGFVGGFLAAKTIKYQHLE